MVIVLYSYGFLLHHHHQVGSPSQIDLLVMEIYDSLKRINICEWVGTLFSLSTMKIGFVEQEQRTRQRRRVTPPGYHFYHLFLVRSRVSLLMIPKHHHHRLSGIHFMIYVFMLSPFRIMDASTVPVAVRRFHPTRLPAADRCLQKCGGIRWFRMWLPKVPGCYFYGRKISNLKLIESVIRVNYTEMGGMKNVIAAIFWEVTQNVYVSIDTDNAYRFSFHVTKAD